MVTFEATAPRTPYSHFVRNEQLQPSLTAGFRNKEEASEQYGMQDKWEKLEEFGY